MYNILNLFKTEKKIMFIFACIQVKYLKRFTKSFTKTLATSREGKQDEGQDRKESFVLHPFVPLNCEP